MQGANAVVARHRKSLERDELSKLLVRQLKLSNVSRFGPSVLLAKLTI